ncbi:ABC transporter permease [Paenibacillus faecalis]|uniref:ABC transporter permease n=1 Tax=Paenibacillus faecalis TaxID=2079532 RepID=UPI000D0F32FE|nr:ABC transporter permease [Paenibacillus faecalis]
MRRIRTFLEMLFRQFVHDIKINIVILCTLTFTFTFLFLISAAMMAKLSEYQDLNEAARTYEIRFSGAHSVQSFHSILNEFKQKKIEKITFMYVTVTDSALHRLNPRFDDKDAYLNPRNTAKSMISGRAFSESELEHGSNVIILSKTDHVNHYENYKVGDTIPIADLDFTLIGISKDDREKVGSLIPYSTILKYKEKFRVNEAYITLEEKASKKEIRQIVKSAKSKLDYDTEYRITTSSSWKLKSMLKHISGSVIAALIVSVLCIFNLMHLVKIILLRNKTVMNIYRNLGYEHKYIVLNFAAILFLLTCSSIVAGSYLSHFIGPVIQEITPIH